MNIKVLVVSIVLVLFCGSLPVYAEETATPETAVFAETPVSELSTSGDLEVSQGVTVYDLQVVESVPDVLSKGLEKSVEEVFGTYTPRFETVTYYLSDGTSYTAVRQVPGLAGMDWEWIISMELFCLSLYSFFRVVGMVIQRC